MFADLRRDIQAVRERDPAARSTLEVLLCYPGVHALAFHRFAHAIWRRGFTVPARFMSHIARFLTGIEIHPAAKLGPGLFIDHGMGVVIGETSEVGENVTLLQGVTLGGTSLKREKRHPTLGNNVVVGTGAKVLGNIAIGDNVKIGAGSVVVHDVPGNSTVVGIPGRVVRIRPEGTLEHGRLPDPEGQAIDDLARRVAELEDIVRQLTRPDVAVQSARRAR